MAVRAIFPAVSAVLFAGIVTGAVFAGDAGPDGLQPKPMPPVGADPQAELPAAPPAKKVQTVPIEKPGSQTGTIFDDSIKPVDPKAAPKP